MTDLKKLHDAMLKGDPVEIWNVMMEKKPMMKQLDIHASNHNYEPIVIRTATGEVGIIAGDRAIYFYGKDITALVEGLMEAKTALLAENFHPLQ